MRLFEAILAANQRWLNGERGARVPAEVTSALPIAALTCIDARLNHLLPDVLGVPEEQFIWLRNAGAIITGPLSSTMRSLALACAVKGAREIAIIGHTDCLVGHTTTLQLLDRLAALGVDRSRLPPNLVEYFGLFATERQNVLRGVECVRASPLIGPKIVVHGLLLDVKTGGLEWVANGYTAPEPTVAGTAGELFARADQTLETLGQIGNFATSELKLPETRIGEFVSTARDWLHQAEHVAAALAPAAPEPAAPPPPPAAIPPPYLHDAGTSFSELVRKRLRQRKTESNRQH
ncbi:carbonic anhydrase [Opitutus terrae]|uniref:Carbonic anhydrase n=1 Tax=Opitutus terrae (strain DSM 11246 / JCM 15787 / PB90-1) TaxID=452637 RepID=B1ZYS8_OPITP|nr:carbonic anhydrase [Opitutus terrae]ACB75314.1 carbonic anhydrase [Opitutus terrae PB90-1]